MCLLLPGGPLSLTSNHVFHLGLWGCSLFFFFFYFTSLSLRVTGGKKTLFAQKIKEREKKLSISIWTCIGHKRHTASLSCNWNTACTAYNFAIGFFVGILCNQLERVSNRSLMTFNSVSVLRKLVELKQTQNLKIFKTEKNCCMRKKVPVDIFF